MHNMFQRFAVGTAAAVALAACGGSSSSEPGDGATSVDTVVDAGRLDERDDRIEEAAGALADNFANNNADLADLMSGFIRDQNNESPAPIESGACLLVSEETWLQLLALVDPAPVLEQTETWLYVFTDPAPGTRTFDAFCVADRGTGSNPESLVIDVTDDTVDSLEARGATTVGERFQPVVPSRLRVEDVRYIGSNDSDPRIGVAWVGDGVTVSIRGLVASRADLFDLLDDVIDDLGDGLRG